MVGTAVVLIASASGRWCPTYWQNGRRLTLIQSASVPETMWWAIMRGLRSSLMWNETIVSNTWYARKLHATSSPPRL